MLKKRPLFEFDLNENVKEYPLTYYVPGHLPKKIVEYHKRMKTLSVTFLTFSPDGSELLVNLGGEQLYLFDLNGKNQEATLKYDSFKYLLNDEAYSSHKNNQFENTTSASSDSKTK